MHRLHRLAHERADDRAQREDLCGPELIEAFVIPLRLDDCVEIAAVGHVYDERAEAWNIDLDTFGGHVGRNVTDRDTRDLVAVCRVIDADQPGGYFQVQVSRG